MKARRSLRSRDWQIVAVFIAMTGLQACVAAFSIELLSSVRAYVTGESLYSKGQKDAQIYLLDYAEKHREADYARFMAALAVPLGDRAAREALQRPKPDFAKARQGFLDGGNHPDDIDGLVRMFRWFQHFPLMSRPIDAWTEGDRVIEQMRGLVDRARERILAGDVGSEAVTAMRQQVPVLNARLTQLESDFSAQLGEASRATQRLLLGLNSLIALLLTLTGLAFVRRSALLQASTEAEVVNRQESLQRLLDSTAEGLYGVDVNGRCTFINKAALTMLGYAREADLLGRDVDALVHRAQPDVRPSYGTRQAVHLTDKLFWRRDGSSFPVEYWSHPIVHDGAVQGAVATFFDISERVEMQAALRRGEMRMERLIDAVTDGVVTIGQDRKVVLFNRAAEVMFGTAAPEAIGSPVDRFLANAPQVRGQAANEPSRSPPADPLTGLRELIGKRADGLEFPIEASLSRLETERGTLTTVVLRDVTALHATQAERRARETVEAASRAKTEFLSRMSHELRTPLNAVIGFSQLLRMDASRPLSVEQLERVDHVESAGEHLLALVNDVLDLSRIEAGEMAVRHESVAVSVAVEEAATMVSPLVSDAGVEIFLASGPTARAEAGPRLTAAPAPVIEDELWVLADRVRLRQVLVNLLSNAVKYNRPGGSVVLTWQAVEGHCEISVIDTGQGIAADQLSGLFEPFNRLGAEASKVEGTGIGLVLSRQLAEMMGGTLRISSVFGEGTVALLTLRTAPAPESPLRAAAAGQPAGGGRTLRLLYAEDNEVNAELMRQIVRLRPSVSLQVAENGSSALEMATLDPPDLMLIDMNLGDMTGLDLARALRNDRSTREIRMFALSADALPEQIDAALRGGFEGYLTKPINFGQLLALLDGEHTPAA